MKEIRRKQRAKRIIIERRLLVFVLIYLVLFIAYYSITSFSRYSSIGIGNTQTSIATWNVSIDTDTPNAGDTLNIVSGNTPQSYKVRVKSESEVASSYTIVISDLPNDIQVSLDGGNYIAPTSHEVRYTNIGSFAVNELNNEHEHTITFSAPLNTDSIGASSINIRVRFSQVI